MEEKPDKKAEEPEVVYNKKKITFYNSIEEMNEADHAFYRNLTPEERLKIHFELTLRFFPKIKNTSRRFSF